MSFDPNPGQEIRINGETIKFLPLEEQGPKSAFVYAESGKEGTVYKVRKGQEYYALKVFYPKYQDKRLLTSTQKVSKFKHLRGFKVADRTVVDKKSFPNLVDQYPDLNYAILMPWIDGTLWTNLATSSHSLDNKKYFKIAQTLVNVIGDLETQGVAHCDLSNNNFIINPRLDNVELIDVEDMYAPDMPRPIPDISYGTPGYRTKWIAENGLWGPSSDRFACAILCSEIITWHNKEIREQMVEGEEYRDSYFSEEDIGEKNNDRYKVMRARLSDLGEDFVVLFDKAWFSKDVNDCPPVSKWMAAVNNLDGKPIQVKSINISDHEDIPMQGSSRTISKNLPPKLVVSHSMLDFGVLTPSGNSMQLTIENVGSSVLTGAFTLVPWLGTSIGRFSIQPGDSRKIDVYIKPDYPKPQIGVDYRSPNALIIESNIGTEVVGVNYKIQKPPFYKTWFGLFLAGLIVLLVSWGIWYGLTADDRLYNQAQLSFQSGNYDLAIQEMNLLFEKYPENRDLVQETYLRWGRQMSDAQQYEQSNVLLLEGKKLSGNDKKNDYRSSLLQNYLELAKNEYKNNNLDEGVAYLDEAKIYDPENKNESIVSLYDDFYIAYADAEYSNKNYEESLSFLEKVNPTGIKSKSSEVQNLYQNIYFDWIDSLANAKGYEKGLKLLEQAKKYFVNAADQSKWADKRVTLYINWANSLSSSSKFREAMEKIDQAKKLNLSTQQTSKVEQSSSSILKSFSNSQGDQAKKEITNLAAGLCGPQHSANPPYPIFATNAASKTYVIYNLTNKDISHSASPGAIYYVACVTSNEPSLVEYCPYNSGYSISRYQRSWNIVLYNILSGKKINSTQLAGASPSKCNYTEMFTIGDYSNDRYADMSADNSVISAWISKYVK